MASRSKAESGDDVNPDDRPDELEMELPYWISHHRTLLSAGLWRVAGRLPRLTAQATRLAWKSSRIDIVVAVAGNLVAGVFTAFGLLATTKVLTALLSAGPTPERVRAALPALALVGGAVATRAALLAVAGWAQSRLRPQIDRLIQRLMVERTTEVELRAFEDDEFHDAQHRARDRGSTEGGPMVESLIDMLTAAVGVAAAGIALGILHPILLPLLVISVLPDGWAAVRAARMRYETRLATSVMNRRKWILADLMSDIRAAAEIRSFTMRGFLLDRFDRVTLAEERMYLKMARRQALTLLAGKSGGGAGTLAVYAALGVLLARGVLPLAVAGTAVLAIRAAQGSLSTLLYSVNRCYEHGLYFDDCMDFITEAARHVPPPGSRPLPATFGRITVDEVTFTYPGTSRPALRGVSLEIRRGQVIALVGENGSGKTTLAKVLAGLYPPDSGQVRWDDTALAEVEREELWERIAVVAQDHSHWPLSARHNIAMGRALDPAALDRAARASGADQVVAALPAGYDTMLDRRFKGGHELSGGQWQRISAARGFYRSAPLLIADEPTAALDARAEHALFETIRGHADGRRTVLLITHRLASVRHADRIYVLADGAVIEEGGYAELMSRDGLFAELYRLQASQYELVPTPRDPQAAARKTPETGDAVRLTGRAPEENGVDRAPGGA